MSRWFKNLIIWIPTHAHFPTPFGPCLILIEIKVSNIKVSHTIISFPKRKSVDIKRLMHNKLLQFFQKVIILFYKINFFLAHSYNFNTHFGPIWFCLLYSWNFNLNFIFFISINYRRLFG